MGVVDLLSGYKEYEEYELYISFLKYLERYCYKNY